MNQRKPRLYYSFALLILYIFLGFFITNTTFSNNLLVYICFLGLFALFALELANEYRRTAGIYIDKIGLMWLPFILYVCGSYFLSGDIEHMVYWFICLFIIILGTSRNISEVLPWKLLVYIGIFSIIGILVQMLLPSFYDSNIATLFTNSSQIIYWEHYYGYTGFTYQLDTAAMPILFTLGIVIAGIVASDKRYRNIIFIVISIIFVFLTGKRMLAAVAIVSPIVVYYVSSKKPTKKILIAVSVCMAFLGVVWYLSANADQLLGSTVFRRFAETFIKITQGEDISSGRNTLYDAAFSAFSQKPLFGVGIGKFKAVTNSHTSVHNTYLSVLCELGIFGMVLFMLPLIISLFITVKTIRYCTNEELLKYLKFSFFVQIVYILYSFSGNTNENLFGYVIYFIGIAILIDVRKQIRVRSDEEILDINRY